jgi:hypothetical protein
VVVVGLYSAYLEEARGFESTVEGKGNAFSRKPHTTGWFGGGLLVRFTEGAMAVGLYGSSDAVAR